MTYEQACAYTVVALCQIPVSKRTTDYEGIARALSSNMVALMGRVLESEIVNTAQIVLQKGRTGEKMISKKAAQDYAAVALDAAQIGQLNKVDLMYVISLMNSLMQDYTPAEIKEQAEELLSEEAY